MERRRGNATLAHVNGVVGRDKAFAEQDLHALERALFDERIARLVYEDLMDVCGVVNEDDQRPHEAVMRYCPEGAVAGARNSGIGLPKLTHLRRA